MIKTIFILMTFIVLSNPVWARRTDKYIIDGTIRGIDSGWVWMKQKTEQGDRLLDSARIENGKFRFEGNLAQGIQSVNLHFNRERGKLVVFLEPGKIKIDADKQSIYYATVEGTPNNEKWGHYLREERRLAGEEERMAKLYQASFETKDREKVAAATKAFKAATEARKQQKADFLTAPDNKYVAACWYRANQIHRMQFHDIDSVITSLGQGLEQNNDYRLMLARRELVRKQAVGQKFGDIRLTDRSGNLRSLDELKGKWVLVDFWASWCGPCRREGKHVLELYRKYRPQGFEVFGVSIDQNTDHWKKAIQEDQTPWIHVCDRDGKVAKEFGVTVIPHLFLLNPEGKIEAVNIRGEELTRKLEAVFPQ